MWALWPAGLAGWFLGGLGDDEDRRAWWQTLLLVALVVVLCMVGLLWWADRQGLAQRGGLVERTIDAVVAVFEGFWSGLTSMVAAVAAPFAALVGG